MKRTLVVLLTTMAVLLTVGQPAQAAQGTFGYYITSWNDIDNPTDNHCYDLHGSASVVQNSTNTTVWLYEDAACTITSLMGAATSHGLDVNINDVFPLFDGVGSVRFSATPLG